MADQIIDNVIVHELFVLFANSSLVILWKNAEASKRKKNCQDSCFRT